MRGALPFLVDALSGTNEARQTSCEHSTCAVQYQFWLTGMAHSAAESDSTMTGPCLADLLRGGLSMNVGLSTVMRPASPIQHSPSMKNITLTEPAGASAGTSAEPGIRTVGAVWYCAPCLLLKLEGSSLLCHSRTSLSTFAIIPPLPGVRPLPLVSPTRGETPMCRDADWARGAAPRACGEVRMTRHDRGRRHGDDGHVVTLAPLAGEDIAYAEGMLQKHLYETSRWHDLREDCDGDFPEPDVRAYAMRRDGRRGYAIMVDGERAGILLARRGTELDGATRQSTSVYAREGGVADLQVVALCIRPRSRDDDVARAIARAVVASCDGVLEVAYDDRDGFAAGLWGQVARDGQAFEHHVGGHRVVIEMSAPAVARR